MSARRVEWANALRGVAAASVLLFHFGVVFWVRQDVAASLARRPALYAADTGAPLLPRLVERSGVDLGGFGVALFFLLSGFVIAISLERYSRRGFIVGRLLRVLPTYAAGFAVTVLVVRLMGDPAHELSVAGVLAGMVPGLALATGVQAPGDGIVWTLIIELVFYGICLIAYRRLARGWVAPAAVAVGCVLVQLLVPAPHVIAGSAAGGATYILLLALPFLPVMLIGAVLSGARRAAVGRGVAWLVVVLLAATHLLLLSTSHVLPTTVGYRLTFLGAIGLFCALVVLGDTWRPNRTLGRLADVSYPLYVVHPVLGYALISVLVHHGTPAGLAVLAATVVVLGAAWLLHVTVEVPTHRLGRRWARRLSATPDAPVRSPELVAEGIEGGTS
ncbi:acyltransferase family protein [Cellulomonas sp. SG140]|uniref:acyltransferase family protein n=1 Tax=Cellulomonas sp. SG140 TaxID=2976536 RepID=UPI0021E7A075|nr:acyltransferase [Cellulomonas sp. SG140]